MVTPDAYMQMGKIVNMIEESGLTISNFKIAKLGKVEAEKFCEAHKGKPHFNEMVNFLSSDLILAIEILAENAINKVRDVVGGIRAKFGSDQLKSAVICS